MFATRHNVGHRCVVSPFLQLLSLSSAASFGLGGPVLLAFSVSPQTEKPIYVYNVELTSALVSSISVSVLAA